MPLALFIIYLIFRFISATVEEFIAAGITYISDYFKLSEALAGVTLIALANGAGDVITAIVACRNLNILPPSAIATPNFSMWLVTLI